MSVLSIRFLADVAVAYAWLNARGYTMESVTDYISMLKYQDPARFGGRYPSPSTALRIPAKAADEPRVDERADLNTPQLHPAARDGARPLSAPGTGPACSAGARSRERG